MGICSAAVETVAACIFMGRSGQVSLVSPTTRIVRMAPRLEWAIPAEERTVCDGVSIDGTIATRPFIEA